MLGIVIVALVVLWSCGYGVGYINGKENVK